MNNKNKLGERKTTDQQTNKAHKKHGNKERNYGK